MHVMRFSWTTFALFGGLLALLVILGALQYRWQSQISDSQRDKMHKMAQEEAGRFAEDFNKEIQNAYFNFQVGAGDWRAKNYRPFLERYEFWKSKTNYPILISEFYLFDAAGESQPLKYDSELKTFVAVDWTPELRDVFTRASNEKTFSPIYDDIYTLVLPQHDIPPEIGRAVARTPAGEREVKLRIPDPLNEPKTYGYLAIKLDPTTIKEKILPDLTAKYFADGDFNINVTDRNGQAIYQTASVAEPDARAGLFELSPSDVYFFANRDVANSISERRESVVVNSRLENHTIARTDVNGQGTVHLEIHNADKPKTQIFTTTKLEDPGAHWTISTQHIAGSIDAFIANTEYRNLAMGYGILGLLGLAVAAIIYSAQRAKAFAQRQVDFVSSVSHEFRTPLAVIYSAGENLADGVTKDIGQTSKYGELIKAEGRKLSAMVEQILEFAGANSGKRRYKLTRSPVAEIVDHAIDECRPLLNDRNIELESDVDDDLPEINADPEALSRAIQNLIANSVKYSNGSGWVRISAYNGDGMVKISVEDRGIGISKSDLRQVFEPFFRSKDVVDAQIHGNGLGLALVKQIAEAHLGHVLAESEPGQGSKFTIELPVEK